MSGKKEKKREPEEHRLKSGNGNDKKTEETLPRKPKEKK